MEYYGIKKKCCDVHFHSFFAGELQNSIKTQRNDSYQLL